ncbi:hypothetical protein IAQ61_011822 [Plenodomus lingam]|uniref:uncharacterized protein n=1 Tax=Leptosphaeria maculans TaxID=5022 RepID=UPI003326C497|nr:hypothetical protein IAQ61_011822 [Plenodomus lingam]
MTAQLSTELVWNNAQSVYEGHGEWRLTVYTLLPNSDPLPPSSLGAPLVFRSVSPECQCWDAGRDLGSRFEAGVGSLSLEGMGFRSLGVNTDEE